MSKARTSSGPFFLIDLVSSYARRCFKASDLVYLDTLVSNPTVQVFQNISRQIFSRRVQLLVERRELVDVSMVEVFYDLIRGGLEVNEVDQQSDVVELLAAGVDLDLVIVTVKVLALP